MNTYNVCDLTFKKILSEYFPFGDLERIMNVLHLNNPPRKRITITTQNDLNKITIDPLNGTIGCSNGKCTSLRYENKLYRV